MSVIKRWRENLKTDNQLVLFTQTERGTTRTPISENEEIPHCEKINVFVTVQDGIKYVKENYKGLASGIPTPRNCRYCSYWHLDTEMWSK